MVRLKNCGFPENTLCMWHELPKHEVQRLDLPFIVIIHMFYFVSVEVKEISVSFVRRLSCGYVVNDSILLYCISAVASEESCGVQPSVSDVSSAVQQSVADSGTSPETRKKHAKKLHKRRRKAGMH